MSSVAKGGGRKSGRTARKFASSQSSPPTIVRYFELREEYKRRYRDRKLVVVMQVGNFFRIQGAEDCGDSLEELMELSDLLRLQTFYQDNRRTPEIPSKTNPRMIGYPTAKPDDYFRKMVYSGGYWVVVVEETEAPAVANSGSRREVTRILSPATLPSSSSATSEDDSIVSSAVLVVCEATCSTILGTRALAMVALELVSGENRYYTRETRSASTAGGRHVLAEDLERWIHTVAPRQIVSYVHVGRGANSVLSPTEPLIPRTTTKIRVRGTDVDILHFQNDPRLDRQEYQEQLFHQYLPTSTSAASEGDSILSRVDGLGLSELSWVRLAYAVLLTHLYEMDRAVLYNMRAPVPGDGEHSMRLAKNAIKELHVSQIAGNLIRCQTSIGTRMLAERLACPSTDPEEISSRLDYIDACSDCSSTVALRPFDRMEMAVQRMIMGKARFPRDAIVLIDCLRGLVAFPHSEDPKLKSCSRFRPFDCGDILAEVLDIFDEEGLLAQDPVCVFKDRLVDEQRAFSEIRDASFFFLDKLRNCVGRDHVSFEERSADGHVWSGPKGRLPSSLGSRAWSFRYPGSDRTFHWGSPHVKVRVVGGSTQIFVHSALSFAYGQQRTQLLGRILSSFKDEMRAIAVRHRSKIFAWLHALADLDVASAAHRYASKSKHVRPVVDGGSGVKRSSGRLTAEGLRHPIVEHNNRLNAAYVPNDFELSDERQGLMLYGINSSGKSCAMRSIGLAVIMAQAGLRVAANHFKIAPFRTIMTRICGGDDLLGGKSSYAMEMIECLPIAEQADSGTLVLGDEIAHSTDIASGTALVGALMDLMIERGCKFVLATHMRALFQLAEESGIVDRLQFRHFHVEEVQGGGQRGNGESSVALVFSRDLREGMGPASYGLDVAEHLGIPPNVILSARRKLKKLHDTPDSLIRVSRYNPYKIYTPICTTPGCDRPMCEEDHVVGQCNADDNGFLPGSGTLHKHHSSNLQGLCHQCHRDKTTAEQQQRMQQRNTSGAKTGIRQYFSKK